MLHSIDESAPPITITVQTGAKFKVTFTKGAKSFHYKPRNSYLITVDWLILGEYETPAQVEAVILELKAAIKRGDDEFTFPTVEEVDAGTMPTSAKRFGNTPA